jgi:hypothetical protein
MPLRRLKEASSSAQFEAISGLGNVTAMSGMMFKRHGKAFRQGSEAAFPM